MHVKDQQEKPNAEISRRQWVKNSKGTVDVYANNLTCSWSLFDVRMLFGHLKPDIGNSDEFIVEEQAGVTIPWAQAKDLAAILFGMVEAYESVNGVIPKLHIAPRYGDIKK